MDTTSDTIAVTGQEYPRLKTAYKVNLPVWNGPMELLLDLIKAKEINIYDIPIAEITHDYLQVIELMQKLDIELAADFLAMAATLIHIKSRMLLPAELDTDDEGGLFRDPRSDLIQQLLEYQKFKIVAEVLETKSLYSDKIIERRDKQEIFSSAPEEEESIWKNVTLFELIRVFSGVIDVMDYDDFNVLRNEEFSVSEKMDMITARLTNDDRINFYDLFTMRRNKNEIIVTFLAILELYKYGKITIKQHSYFGDIFIFRKNLTPYNENSLQS